MSTLKRNWGKSWKGEKVLVTGAGGFIGSHLVERLVEYGAIVTAVVRYNSMNDWHLLSELPRRTLQRVRVLEGDVRDGDFVRQACDGIATVFHLAATISIPHSYRIPMDFVLTNVVGTTHVLAAASACACRRIVCTSTSEVYGTAVSVPMGETHRLHPQSPYAASKEAADAMALAWHRSFGAPVVLVRPFNTYGPRQSARAIVPTILAQLLRGNTVRVGEVSTKRDLTYVDDTVAGFLAAALSDEAVGHVINLGTGQSIAVSDIIHTAAALLGRKARILIDKERLRPERSEVRVLQADASRAAALLGWRSVVPLEEGLERTAKYIRRRLERYKPGEYLR